MLDLRLQCLSSLNPRLHEKRHWFVELNYGFSFRLVVFDFFPWMFKLKCLFGIMTKILKGKFGDELWSSHFCSGRISMF